MIASLRSRIALGTTVATAVVVLVAAVSVWFAGQAILWRTVDHRLDDHARAFDEHGVPIFERGHEAFGTGQAGGYFLLQVLRPDHREVLRSFTLTGSESLAPLLDAPPRTIVDLRLASGRQVRGLWLPGMAHRMHATGEDAAAGGTLEGMPVVALEAYDTTAFHAELTRLGYLLAMVWVGAVALSALISVWLCRAVLRPVDRLSAVIERIDPERLDGTVADAPVPPEMRVLVTRLNELFVRVQDTMTREKATIASIAHELRTPIAGLRTTLEFALGRAADPGARQVQERCLALVVQMQAMVANLLTLARLEAGQEVLAREPVEMVGLLEACWEQVECAAVSRQLEVRWQLPERAVITSAREQLRSVLVNILDNAVSYTPVGKAITIVCALSGEQLALSVTNDTDGTLQAADRVFEPFWRGDRARSGGLHCGLGLALVQRLVRCLGGTVSATVPAGAARFELHLTLPGAMPVISAA